MSDEKEEAPRKHFHGPKPGETPDVNKINYVQELISNTLSENCIPLDYNTICGMASFLLANLLGQHRCIEDIISTVIDNLDHASFETVDIRKPS